MEPCLNNIILDNSTSTSKNLHGFTLIELTVAMAVMAAGAAVAAWGLNFILPNLQIKVAVSNLKSDMHLARLTAIKQNTFIVSEFNTDQNTYTIFIDDGGGDSRKAHNYTHDKGEKIIRSVHINPHVKMSGAKFGAVDGKFAFNSRGATDGLAGGIYLYNKTKSYRGVAVSRIGKITIKVSKDGKQWLSLN